MMAVIITLLICATVLAVVHMVLGIQRKEHDALKAEHAALIAKTDILYREVRSLATVKDEIASIKVSLGWQK